MMKEDEIMLDESFSSFVTSLDRIPHIASKIIENLDIRDVVNCLRTSKTLRLFILGALEQDKNLQTKLNIAVVKETSSNCKWKSSQCHLLGPKGEGFQKVFMNAFGLDDQIWMSLGWPFKASDLGVYQLGTGKIETLSMDSFAKFQVLSEAGQVLVDDDRDVMVVSCVNGKIGFRNVHERLFNEKERRTYFSYSLTQGNVMANVPAPMPTRDGIYDVIRDGRNEFIIFFDDRNGLPNPNGPILFSGPHIRFNKKGDKILITSLEDARMLDFKTGAEVWRKKFDFEDLTPESHLYPNQSFLTDQLCGFIFSRQDSWPEFTRFELLLLDANTGREIHCGKCWDWKRGDVNISSRQKQFEVVADGNEICIANVGKEKHGFDYCRLDENYFWKLKEDITFVCARYNPEDGTCQVYKTSTGLEQVLLAKCREAEDTTSAKKQGLVTDQEFISAESVEITRLTLHGISAGAIVLGSVRFNYFSQYGSVYLPSASAAFTINLDLMFETHEPAATFAAIGFPLDCDMLLEKSKAFGFCPYYKSSKDGVVLSGLVAIDGEIHPKTATVHSFQTALEWTSHIM